MGEPTSEPDRRAPTAPGDAMSRRRLASERTAPDADERRRERIAEIVEEDDLPMTLDTLTERVIETDPEVPSTPESRSSLHERLYLRDLPELEREGRLTFDIERGLVTTGDRASAVAAVEAESGRGSHDSPSDGPGSRGDGDGDGGAWRYLAATGAAVSLFALTVLEVGVFVAMSPTLVAVAAVGLFAGLALTEG